MRRYDHTDTDEIVCPHCGYTESDSWEYQDDEDVIECPECEKPFTYIREVAVSYSTYKEEYERCTMCNEEKVLEDVSWHITLSKHTKHKKLCSDCIKKLKLRIWAKESKANKQYIYKCGVDGFTGKYESSFDAAHDGKICAMVDYGMEKSIVRFGCDEEIVDTEYLVECV